MAPQNGSTLIYTTNQPIRLDGIDVNPAQGTVFTLDTANLDVTASGDSQMLLGGVAFTFELNFLVLNYRGGANPAGGNNVSVDDVGSGTGPAALGLNVFGLPISLGTRGPLGFGLPVVETTGQTVMNGGIQVALDTRRRRGTSRPASSRTQPARMSPASASAARSRPPTAPG